LRFSTCSFSSKTIDAKRVIAAPVSLSDFRALDSHWYLRLERNPVYAVCDDETQILQVAASLNDNLAAMTPAHYRT
jgi:hypothetical protein